MSTTLPTAPRLYPDTVTMKRIGLANEKSTDDNYWTKSTQQALTKALQPLELSEATDILCLGHNGWAPDYLDIVHKKAPNAHITVLDTQANQIQTMEDYFEEHTPRTPADNYTLLTTADFTKPPETLYDLVLLYHLTNHIPTKTATAFATTLNNYLKPDGTVVMLTAHNTAPNDGTFVKRLINLEGTAVETIESDNQQFNQQLAKVRLEESQQRELPTRRMNSVSIKLFFKNLGVTLQQLVPFHMDDCILQTEASKQLKYVEHSDLVGQDIICVGTRLNKEA